MSYNFEVIAVAFTGIAASLLFGGQTIHSKLKIPIPTEQDSISRLQVNSQAAKIIRYSKILVIDEAGSTSKHVYSCVDRFLRDVRQNPNVPFGGIVVLLTGDFRQTLPVPDEFRLVFSVELSITGSPIWQYFEVLKLTQNMRALPDEIDFKNWQFLKYFIL